MKKVKVTCNVTPRTKAEIDCYVETENFKSQSEFCAKAIAFYLAYLHEENNKDFLGKVISQTVDATVEHHADRISAMLFKLAVGFEKQNLINRYDDNEAYLEELAIDNVRKRSGRL